MSFTPIAFIDTFDLVASLPPRIGLFRHVESGERLLPIRGYRKDTDPAEELFAWHQTYAKWPEIKNTIGQMRRLAAERIGPPGIELGRVFLEMLDGGTALPWRRPEASAWIRAHLPLRTNPAAFMFAGRESMHLLPGQLTVVAPAWGCAVNWGEFSRIHLVVDFKRKREPPVDR
jgi:hypothetical protein